MAELDKEAWIEAEETVENGWRDCNFDKRELVVRTYRVLKAQKELRKLTHTIITGKKQCLNNASL